MKKPQGVKKPWLKSHCNSLKKSGLGICRNKWGSEFLWAESGIKAMPPLITIMLATNVRPLSQLNVGPRKGIIYRLLNNFFDLKGLPKES